ncbi:hypothetical protein OG455_30265 [Kitasatospora sp. NBC_01287]|uniref:hypothetical protein n=1 Tax=Kitasatospora sp. NBC_01287 TaxID=2903573 RepID=UPI00224C8D6F|nr:hypothetical protein [Kitasatospora sp. NBC_01287]MCX4749748.1 hypothetical protein [Kitasatospora sp. NBC_01287]
MPLVGSQEQDPRRAALEVGYRRPGSAGSILVLVLPAYFAGRFLASPNHVLVDLGWVVSALFPVLVVSLLVVERRRRTQGWALRLDAAGVTVRDAGTVPWSELSEVRWTVRRGLRPAAVVFTARPGVPLAAFPTMLPFARSKWRAARLVKRYGGPLVVLSSPLPPRLPEVLAAVQRYSEVPVTTD